MPAQLSAATCQLNYQVLLASSTINRYLPDQLSARSCCNQITHPILLAKPSVFIRVSKISVTI
jgi:hypothetical protein